MRIRSCVLGSSKLVFLGVVRGLVSEAIKVKASLEQEKPESIALSISPEELEGLREYLSNQDKGEQELLSNYEQIYADKLSSFGAVQFPPPCFVAAVEIAEKSRLPVVAIDLDDEAFTNAYCAYVTTLQLVLHSLRVSRIRRKNFEHCKSPEEFVCAWDRTVNNLKGFRTLEERREAHMSVKLRAAAKNYSRIAIVVELERLNGLLTKLTRGET